MLMFAVHGALCTNQLETANELTAHFIMGYFIKIDLQELAYQQQ